ncbi:hypothetical protein Dsin_017181 [Dipteronia sinensis]|uniref:BAG family molecular chaperone regulator 8, chloroplastic n=1 Tax=Dipteronia sinensis TaxID=43782 RepID=A0AAE0AEI4_9ROSI|nr:hypothetical protein Dsin_017181 [Dipteronia sinensis]
MSSSHHHQNTTSTTSGCYCTCCTHHSPPSPLPPATDPLLQAFLSHFLVQQNQGFPCQCQTHQKHHFQQQQDHQQQARFVLPSLFSRIDALEASLHKFSTHNHYSSSSLRNAAARVIQIHFRVFLVCRSRTLRQLKDLAIIKSRFNSLKLSISKKTHLDFQVVSQRATDLLFKLDSIQGGDPMVRDGKRSISIDLVKFLEFVDGFAVRRHEVSFKAAKNVRIVGASNNKTRAFGSNYGDVGRDQSEIMENLRDRIEKINRFFRVSKGEDEDVELEGFHQLTDDDEEEENPRVSRNRNGVLVERHGVAQPRVKKSVSFAENGNVIKVFGNDYNNSSERSSSEDDGQVVENLCEVKAIKASSKVSEDGEEDYLDDSEAQYEIVGNHKCQNGQFVFSAPLPAKMESRADLMKKRKAVKIIT